MIIFGESTVSTQKQLTYQNPFHNTPLQQKVLEFWKKGTWYEPARDDR